MKITVTARRFKGGGMISCLHCNTKVVLPDNASVLMWRTDDGHSVVLDGNGSVRHKCGRKLKWLCDNCGREGEPIMGVMKSKSKAKIPQIVDRSCYGCLNGTLRQQASPQE